ncbi:aminoglycoside phosphotransferase family protein [Kribbella sandramycini]|uniref:Aminoglycoside phosphotransferase (APT) family kinase protein n=1 Tax=Kribbella sandramycini TaxID=60450 RepID=A0A7Y4L0J0_9ACTN|nr:aminoglycoside phosphotransferase (APT) family kinase protein [Kribbella sandramycini]NOL41246.1 aminoglycoside phosphotransferase family protein [Kribbella sandramycini]
MEVAEARRATAAAVSTATELGLHVDEAIVLSDSNRLVVRLLPCDTVARVTPLTHFASAAQEVELVRLLARTDSPVAPLEPRVEACVFGHEGFQVTMWAYSAPAPSQVLPPAEYARTLAHLHAGLRQINLTTPHFMDRVTATQRDAASHDVTPDLAPADRSLLTNALHDLGRSILDRGRPDQLLHGEPHPMNLLTTTNGPLFIDFENTARGPVEYDLAWIPDQVSRHYPNSDPAVLDHCRGLVLAIVATHRWSRDDHHPSGRTSGHAFLHALRTGPPWPTLDTITW